MIRTCGLLLNHDKACNVIWENYLWNALKLTLESPLLGLKLDKWSQIAKNALLLYCDFKHISKKHTIEGWSSDAIFEYLRSPPDVPGKSRKEVCDLKDKVQQRLQLHQLGFV